MELETIKAISEAGLAGVFGFAIFVFWKLGKRMLDLIGNHLNHNTKALTELVDVIRELKGFLKNGRK